jgi:hypothetical protein
VSERALSTFEPREKLMRTGTIALSFVGVVLATATLVFFVSGTRARAKPRKSPIASFDEVRPTDDREGAARQRAREPLHRPGPAAAPPVEPSRPAHVEDIAGEGEDLAASHEAESEAEQARIRKERQALLQQHFERQARTGDWSRDTSMTIRNTLVGLMKPPASVLQSVECRETLCRVEVGTSDESNYVEAFQALLQARWSFGTGAFFLTRNDESGSTKGLVMFLGQNGLELPDVTEAMHVEK